MKKYILISMIASSFVTAVQADEVESAYRHLLSFSMFTSNDDILKSGWYSIDGVGKDNADLDNSNFVGSYYFGDSKDKFRFFVLGGFGFSKLEQDSINLHRSNGSIDKAELDSFYWKAGGGLNYNPSETLGLVTGASAMWMSTDGGNYDEQYALNMNNAKDRKIQKIFNEDNDNRLYDLFAGFIYHPMIAGYHTYFIGAAHYLKFDYNDNLEDTDGYDFDLKAGFHTPVLTTLYNYPVWAEFFVASNLLDSDLGDLVGFDNAFTGGTAVHWKIGPEFKDFFNGAFKDVDVSLNLQGTTGDNSFSGWKASVCLGIVKF